MIRSSFRKPIKRRYFDVNERKWMDGAFIAKGEKANGHLPYTRLGKNGEDVEGEETLYVQNRRCGMLAMFPAQKKGIPSRR